MVTQQPGKFWLFPLLMALFPAISVMTIKTSLLLSHTVPSSTYHRYIQSNPCGNEIYFPRLHNCSSHPHMLVQQWWRFLPHQRSRYSTDWVVNITALSTVEVLRRIFVKLLGTSRWWLNGAMGMFNTIMACAMRMMKVLGRILVRLLDTSRCRPTRAMPFCFRYRYVRKRFSTRT